MKVICNITFIFILSVVILNTIYAKPFGHSAIGASGYKRVNMNDFLKKKEQSFTEDFSQNIFKEKLARKVGIFFEKFLTSLVITSTCIY